MAKRIIKGTINKTLDQIKNEKFLTDQRKKADAEAKAAAKAARSDQNKALNQLEDEMELRNDAISLTREISELAKKNLVFGQQAVQINEKLVVSLNDMLKKRKGLINADKISYETTLSTAEAYNEILSGSGKLYNKELMLGKLREEMRKKNISLISKAAVLELEKAEKVFQEVEDLSKLYVKNIDQLEEINKLYSDARDTIDDMKEKTTGMYHTVTQLLKGYGAQTVFLATAYNKVKDMSTEFMTISDTMGLTISQMGKMGGGIVSGIFGGLSPETSMKAFQSITTEFGSLNAATNANVKSAGKMMQLYGMSAESAAKLVHLSKTGLGFNIDNAKALAEANNVPISDMMNDVATNAEFFAMHSKRGGKNIIEASLAAHKMGLDLGAVAKITESMLGDPMASIEKEMQASVLLGKQIDFNATRQKLMNGDQVGALAEIKKQIGGIGEWEKLNFIQRQAISESLGLSAEEMQKMYSTEADAMKLTTQLSSGWVKVTEKIKLGGSSLKEWGVLLASAVGSLGSFLKNSKQIGNALGVAKGGGGLLGGVGGKIGKFLGTKAGMAGAGDVTKDIPKNIPEGATKGPEAMSNGMGKVGSNMSNIVKGAAAMAIMAGAMWIFGKALQEMQKVDLSKVLPVLGVALITFAVAFLAFGTIAEAAFDKIIMGALAMTIISAALWVFGKALQEIGKGLKIMGEFINSLAGWDLSSLAGLAAGLSLLAGAFGLISVAGIGLYLALPAIIGFASAVVMLGVGMAMLSKGLSSITNDLTQLSAISSTLTTIGDGFGSIGIGLMKMGAGLAVVSPFLPVLGAMNAMGIGGLGEGTSGTKEGSSSDKIIEKLDELISAVKSGATVNVDGIRFMRFLATGAPAKGSNSGYSTGQSVY